MHEVTYYGTKPIAYCQIKHLKDLDMVTRDQNPELNLRTFSNVGPSWPDVHKVRLMIINYGKNETKTVKIDAQEVGNPKCPRAPP